MDYGVNFCKTFKVFNKFHQIFNDASQVPILSAIEIVRITNFFHARMYGDRITSVCPSMSDRERSTCTSLIVRISRILWRILVLVSMWLQL